jgi:hypothetical protein
MASADGATAGKIGATIGATGGNSGRTGQGVTAVGLSADQAGFMSNSFVHVVFVPTGYDPAS